MTTSNDPWKKVKTSETSPISPAIQLFTMNNSKRRDSTTNLCSDDSKKGKKSVTEVMVVQGGKQVANFQEVKPKAQLPPRRHYFISRVSETVTIDVMMNNCNNQNFQPIMN